MSVPDAMREGDALNFPCQPAFADLMRSPLNPGRHLEPPEVVTLRLVEYRPALGRESYLALKAEGDPDPAQLARVEGFEAAR